MEYGNMLILTRRIGEVITIGDDIRIIVTNIRGGQASIGIAAPASMPVHREEIAQRIKDGVEQKRHQPVKPA
jgi:carbon storage regulator